MKFLPLLFLLLFSACITSTPSKQIASEHFIFLVRHAEKASDGTKDPPLTDDGEARARRIAKLLADKNIGKVYSTDYKRTRNTAAPMSAALGIETTIYNPRDTSFYNALREESLSKNILVVGHSNSTPSLTNAIIGEEKFMQLDESVYDQLFQVKASKGKYEGSVGSMDQ